MSRALWFAAGAGAGIYVTARVRRAALAFTPEGISDRLAGLSLGLHLFTQEVRVGMAERETELRARVRAEEHHHLELSERRPALTGSGSDTSATREGEH